MKSIYKPLKHKPLKLDIQFFAQDPPADPPADPPNDPPADPPKKVELTETELQKKIEAEADRKLTKALEKKQAEWDLKQQKAIQAALDEKERLSKLSEKERKDEELTTREKDLQKRLADIERKELKSDAVIDLGKKELPAEFADFLLAENAEKTLENINKLKETFDAAVNEAVKGKLRQDTPAASVGANSTKNAFAEMRNKQDQQNTKAPNPWAKN